MSAFIGKIIPSVAFAVNAYKRFVPLGKLGFLHIASSAVALIVFIGVGISLANTAHSPLAHYNNNNNVNASNSAVPANKHTWDLPNVDLGEQQLIHTAGIRNP